MPKSIHQEPYQLLCSLLVADRSQAILRAHAAGLGKDDLTYDWGGRPTDSVVN